MVVEDFPSRTKTATTSVVCYWRMDRSVTFIRTWAINAILIFIERHHVLCYQPCTRCIRLVGSVTQVEKCGIFTHLHDSVVVGSKEIELRHRRIAQIKSISHLTKIGRYGNSHHRMSLVTSALLILRNPFTATQWIGESAPDQFPDITVSYSIIEIVHYIVHHVILLRQNANGQVRRQADQIPVRPVVITTLPSVFF